MMKNSTGLVWHAALALGFVLMPGCSRAPAARIIYHDEQGLWRMTPEGKDIHPLASSGVDGEYSPDNTQIAFSKFYNAGIWVADADGENPDQPTSFGSSPSWSPDGEQIAYVNLYDWCICAVNSDGSGEHRIRAEGELPDWSN